MSLPVQTANNVKIYNVTGDAHHRLPDWMLRKHAKRLKKDADFARRVRLIQDFEFPEASLRLALAPDGQHIVAAGVYKPQFRVFELAEGAMKFERHTTAETVSMQLLGEDWKKLALLQADRYVEFHSPSGLYHSARIPRAGRDMAYDGRTCDLLLAASGHELYRLNLDRGQFMAPFETGADAVNAVRISPLHGLYGLACDNGTVEFWDRRDRRRMGALQIAHSDHQRTGLEVTALHFLPDGLHWAAGTSDGRVLSFDLRTSQPLAVHDHYNGFAVKKIDYHAAARLLVSADRRSIKFWHTHDAPAHNAFAHSASARNASVFTTVESEWDINDFVVQPETGLLLAANETSPIASYFIPALGPAPRWCSFLENLTEEMEEKAPGQAAVYDNFKFVTRTELAQLGLDHLVGTSVLRAYMHGYFVDLRLYEKAKAIANPFAYEEYLARRKQEKLERERQSRIRARDPVRSAKVNRGLVERLTAQAQQMQADDGGDDAGERPLDAGDAEERHATAGKEDKKKRRTQEGAKALLKDDRFADLFNNPDFEIDDQSAEYRHLHPTPHRSS